MFMSILLLFIRFYYLYVNTYLFYYPDADRCDLRYVFYVGYKVGMGFSYDIETILIGDFTPWCKFGVKFFDFD